MQYLQKNDKQIALTLQGNAKEFGRIDKEMRKNASCLKMRSSTVKLAWHASKLIHGPIVRRINLVIFHSLTWQGIMLLETNSKIIFQCNFAGEMDKMDRDICDYVFLINVRLLKGGIKSFMQNSDTERK